MKRIFIPILMAVIALATFSHMVYAFDPNDKICAGGGGGGADSSYCPAGGTAQNDIYGHDGFIIIAANLIAIIGGITTVILIIVAGVRLIASGGDPNTAKGAREMIANALIGLVIIIASRIILGFVIDRFQ